MKHSVAFSILLCLLHLPTAGADDLCPSWLNIKKLAVPAMTAVKCQKWQIEAGKVYWVVIQDPFEFYNRDEVSVGDGIEAPSVCVSVYAPEFSKDKPFFTETALGDYLVGHRSNGKSLKTSQHDIDHDGKTEFYFSVRGAPTDLLAGLRAVLDKKSKAPGVERLTFTAGKSSEAQDFIPTTAGVPIEVETNQITVLLESKPRKVLTYRVKSR